jgi:prephenate dehydratase
MIRIATLGPEGTFAERAALAYAKESKKDYRIILYPSIADVFAAAGKECDMGVVPVENMLEGYVQITLDLLLSTDLAIAGELILPVRFSFVSTAKTMGEVKKVYVQFITQGQCRKFLDSLRPDVNIVTTESNGVSLEQIKKDLPGEAAIVPQHSAADPERFGLVVGDVTDHAESRTRFIVLSGEHVPFDFDPQKAYKTSIVILEVADRPGALYAILKEFAERKINLTSIMSRPTKLALGHYHFFIDIDGRYPEEEPLKAALDEISAVNKVKILGSYAKAAAG